MQGRKTTVLEVRATDARAAEIWAMHATTQQRLFFDSDRFAPYADLVLPSGGEDVVLDPVYVGGVKLDVVDSAASVECMVTLTVEEV